MKSPLTIFGACIGLMAALLGSSCSSTEGVLPEETTPSYVCVETNSGRILYAQNAT